MPFRILFIGKLTNSHDTLVTQSPDDYHKVNKQKLKLCRLKPQPDIVGNPALLFTVKL